jgi:hypothetical protein
MSGIIEDGEPDGGAGMFAFETVSYDVDLADAPPFDIEQYVDRLRFMGLDREFAREADTRLRSDLDAGLAWVEERLKEMEPPRRAPECDCGAELVDVAWRGRATVRCAVCGSRWGVEVNDDSSESYWEIGGPTDAWLRDHPIGEEDRYAQYRPEDIVRDGLPPLPPDGIAPGAYFPLARWADDRDAAVLYVHRFAAGEFDMPGDEYEDEIEHLEVDDDGAWTNTGGGGGSWVNPFDPPLDLLEKYRVFTTGVSGFSDDDDSIHFIGGMCGAGIAVVEAVDRDGVRTHAIEEGRPFFIVGLRGSACRVRFLDGEGSIVATRDGAPLEIELN